ncbi:MAG TPA: orotidine-5'-phosphate decarboxylase [Patescibacteria group bacterium]|nr:orotidine-5'-phosphate decarboxylase [Patescibacteria group bacterium]
MTGVFCAIDSPSLSGAEDMVRKLAGVDIGLKIGLELYIAEGPRCIDALRALHPKAKIFLDLKLHDIANTVAGAARSAVQCRVDFLTLHTSGGGAMMAGAVDAARDTGAKLGISPPALLGVTVLTNLDDADLAAVGQQGPAEAQVLRLAQLAEASGLQGVVCSPLEIAALRSSLSKNMKLVVPGIRPDGTSAGDQKRTLTPHAAALLGADYLVIGRPITQAADPARAAQEILDGLDRKAA